MISKFTYMRAKRDATNSRGVSVKAGDVGINTGFGGANIVCVDGVWWDTTIWEKAG